MESNSTKDYCVDEDGAAKILGLKPSTLRKMRCVGPQEKGLAPIPYHKYSSRCVRYSVSDLNAWKAAYRVEVGGES